MAVNHRLEAPGPTIIVKDASGEVVYQFPQQLRAAAMPPCLSATLDAYAATSTGILVMLQKTTLWALSGITFLVVVMYIAFQSSQWPSVLYHRHYGRIRQIIEHGWFGLQRALERYAVTARLNERFDTNDPDAVLDVYYPSEVAKHRPEAADDHLGGGGARKMWEVSRSSTRGQLVFVTVATL